MQYKIQAPVSLYVCECVCVYVLEKNEEDKHVVYRV